ncbi:N-acetylmuramoyl-L-alanine amidase [Streptomyces kasugaensis]|uniref:N-acetylmuramoyl-L-alanine amidase n=1 Tax=Streptomyces kasugaensis TaxID=1946 RepID=A0A4Q9HW73_STRKA|nr:peptidoglycan-binding protein [Streptomyces kasugaensis]TBO59205.1 N-acetylmuramoyl-L-alanine amidase [Streptomyces kasugaensis]
MATPLTADRLVAALRAEGVTVIEYGKWRTHNRAGRCAWGPLNGIMIHHTVSSGTDASVRLCYDGYAGLPGPLCHGVIAKNGDVYLVGNGRANHAGLGDDDVLAAVVAERKLPATNANNTDGNARFYGFECVNLGTGADPWPAQQLDAIERVAAAICRAHGWSAASVIGHKEWTNTKVDPRGFSMTTMRERVDRRLGTKPGKIPPAPKFEPFPGVDFFTSYPRSPIVTAMGRRLAAEGCSAYTSGPGPQWTTADRDSFRKWQKKLGDAPQFCDGWPGRRQWDALKVPKV